jgi:hypothetical protein
MAFGRRLDPTDPPKNFSSASRFLPPPGARFAPHSPHSAVSIRSRARARARRNYLT